MKMFPRFFITICVCISLSYGLSIKAQTQSLAEILPENTPLYLKIEKPAAFFLDELRNPVVLDAIRKLPNIGPQIDNPQLDQVKAVLGALGSTEDLSWSQLVREVLNGLAEVGLSANPNKLILSVVPKDVTRLERLHGKLIEFARADARDKGNPDPVSTFSHAGVECFSFTPGEAHAIAGGKFMLASSEEVLKDALDLMTGKKEPKSRLNQSKNFREAMEQGGANHHDAFGLARLDLLRKAGVAGLQPLDEYNPLAALLFGGWVEAYNKAAWLGLALDLKSGKPSLEAILPVDEKTAMGETRQAFTPPLKQFAPRQLQLPNQIGSLELWRDLGKVWNIRESVVKGPALQGLNGLDNGLGQFFGGRDFGTGVLGALKPDWRINVAEQDVKALNPKPDLVLPAFAITVGYDKNDKDFQQRWVIAFQSLIGVINVTGAQQKQPVLMQNQEDFEGAKIYTAKFLPPAKPKDAKDAEDGVHIRHNFRPTLAFADDHLIVATTTEMAREIVKALKQAKGADLPPQAMQLSVDGQRLGRLIDVNRERLVMQNMVEKGHGRSAAEGEIGGLESLVKGLNSGNISVSDTEKLFRFRIGFDLNQAQSK
ncbi:MAG: hypothetical protein ACKO5E_02155 [bacterium]